MDSINVKTAEATETSGFLLLNNHCFSGKSQPVRLQDTFLPCSVQYLTT